MTRTAACRAVERSGWLGLAKAMGTSAAAAALSGIASIAATKILAVTLGPSAVATLQTMQQTRQTAVVAATANGQTALVQGASSLEGANRVEYVRTALCIFSAATAAAVLGLWAAPREVLDRTGLASLGASALSWLGVAIAMTSAYVFLSALLNALGKVQAVSALQAAGPGALALLAYPVARAGGGAGLFRMVAASAAVSAGAALLAAIRYQAQFRLWRSETRVFFSRPSAAHFFSISLAMLLSGFAASATILLVRGNIVRSQGLGQAGSFDAAWSISMNQVTLVLASVQTYYLPALSKLQSPEKKTREISRVLLAGALVSASLIASLAFFKPWVIKLLYSNAFRPAERYLRWTLAGDYLKVSSWILSVPLLASADMKPFLASDLAATATFASASFALIRWYDPAESAAIAFLLMYAVHLTAVFLCLRLRHNVLLARSTLGVWMVGLAVVLGASFASWSAAGR